MTYQEEINLAFDKIYSKTFKAAFQKKTEEKTDLEKRLMLECYVTTDCNQTCSYCYLCKHGNELYPLEYRKPEVILKNFRIFMDYLMENKMFYPERFDFFSGEIWGMELGNSLLEITYEYILKGFHPTKIIIPSNFSFILDDKMIETLDIFIKNYKEQGVVLAFSCSNDGLYNDVMTRPFNHSEEDAELKKGTAPYYDKLFTYCKERGFGFHPMVSAHGIKYWKENFKWWQEQMRKYDIDPMSSIMFLEVRNDDWTDEAIEHYLKYLNYHIEYYWKNYFKSPTTSTNQLYKDWIHCRSGYNSAGLYQPATLPRDKFTPGCTISRSLVVRLGDLSIVPCHRTSYDEFIFGKYLLNEEGTKIESIQAKNTTFMNQVWLNNYTGVSKCNCCPYNRYCLKGCFGSQFEATGDILYPCETVCDLYKARILFLYAKYSQRDLLDLTGEDKEFTVLIDKVKETKEYEKWMPIIQSIIS